MLVTVLVLSYNRPELLRKALESIALQTYGDREVLVIDNLSQSSMRIRDIVSAFPGVRLLAGVTNSGFTGGMNQGLAEATGEYVYLTEDDIELDANCLASLMDHLSQYPEAGLTGPVMWNRGAGTVRCAGGSFKLGAVFDMQVKGAGASSLSESEPFHTMYLPGAAIVARTAFLRELGGFRSDFFMYGEDVELCARVLEHGRSITVVPAARVYHYEPPAQPESAMLTYHKQKNFIALYLLHAPWSVLPGFLIRYGCIEGARRLCRDWKTMPAWTAAWAYTLRRSASLLSQRRNRVSLPC